jgi:hypothetical protein
MHPRFGRSRLLTRSTPRAAKDGQEYIIELNGTAIGTKTNEEDTFSRAVPYSR